ncbi:hypothetical protein D3C76_937050 [compost metagenome]
MGCELDIQDFREKLLHLLVDKLAKLSRNKLLLFNRYITTLLNSLQRWCISTRATNAKLLQRFNKPGFCISRRRLGKMLLRINLFRMKNISDMKRRQKLIILCRSVIVALNIYLHETMESNLGPYCTENNFSCSDINGQGVQHRRRHLACHKTFPYQFIQSELITSHK